MGQTVQLLENALRAWEDLKLIDETVLRIGILNGDRQPQELIGPIRHWRELRNHLLMVPSTGFDHKRFCKWYEPGDDMTLITGKKDYYQELPLQLASWVASSRRVFTLSEDLVMRFISADYSHYTYSDLLWPFDSFVINMEEPFPIQGTDGVTRELSLLFVSSIGRICPDYPYADQDGFELAPFWTSVGDKLLPTEILDRKEHERLDDDLRHKRWVKVDKRKMRLADQFMTALDPENPGLPAGNLDSFSLMKSDSVKQGVTITKILAGLCLYLEALPVGTTDAYHWHQSVPIKAQRELRKIITDGEQICQVNDFNVISPETISLFPETLRAGPAYSVTPHWRRGHFRRAKGQGRNPNAPRTIEVKPTLIHKDQLPEGALPGGAQSSVR